MCPEIHKNYPFMKVIFNDDATPDKDYFPIVVELPKTTQLTKFENEYGMYMVYLQNERHDKKPGFTAYIKIDGKTCLQIILRFAVKEAKTWKDIFIHRTTI